MITFGIKKVKATNVLEYEAFKVISWDQTLFNHEEMLLN
jgi:hypothetical protein